MSIQQNNQQKDVAFEFTTSQLVTNTENTISSLDISNTPDNNSDATQSRLSSFNNTTFATIDSFVQNWNTYHSKFWRIATFNVRGINEKFKFHEIVTWLEDNNIDIACLTETKISEQTAVSRMKLHPNWISSWSIEENHSKGTGIGLLFKKSIGCHVFSWTKTPGRAITATLKFKGKTNISVVGIYGPANYADKKSVKKMILSDCLSSIKSNHHIIALGDFNEDDDVAHHDKSLLRFFQEKGCKDLNSDPFNSKSNITWASSTCTRTIDHIFVSQEFLRISATAHTIGIKKFTNSDHRGIIAQIFISHLITKPKSAQQLKSREKIINLKKCTKEHWNLFSKHLSENFQISNDNNIDDIWTNLKDQIVMAMKKILPWKKVGTSFNFSKQESISYLAALYSNRILKKAKT